MWVTGCRIGWGLVPRFKQRLMIIPVKCTTMFVYAPTRPSQDYHSSIPAPVFSWSWHPGFVHIPLYYNTAVIPKPKCLTVHVVLLSYSNLFIFAVSFTDPVIRQQCFILLLSQVVYHFTCLQYITYIAITYFNSYWVKRSILSVHIVIITSYYNAMTL